MMMLMVKLLILLLFICATSADFLATQPQRYILNISDAAVDDLRMRLSHGRYPSMPARSGQPNELGLESQDLRRIVEYWLYEFDWKEKEAKLNKFDQYTVDIDGMTVHYIHIKVGDKYRKEDGGKIPLLLFVHGWPSTAFDFTKVIPMMTDPEQYGLSGVAYDVVVPSMVGYPLSSAPITPKFGAKQVAKLYSNLVRVLQYDTYVVSGGDWGSFIIPEIAIYEESLRKYNRLLGIHINGILAFPDFKKRLYLLIKFGLQMMFPSFFFDDYEVAKLSFMKTSFFNEAAYMLEHATKPMTIGMALHNSPVALASWLLEKFIVWTDSSEKSQLPQGKLKGRASSIRDQLNISKHALGHSSMTLDDIVTTLSLYWFTDSISSSIMLYHNTLFESPFQVIKDLAWRKVKSTPVGIADFPMDILWAPLAWAKQRYYNIVQYSRFDKGGHFAALEVPDLLAKDLHSFLDKLKTGASTADGSASSSSSSFSFPARPAAAEFHASREKEEKGSADEEL